MKSEERGIRSEESEEIQARKRSLKKHPVTLSVTGYFFSGPRSHESSRRSDNRSAHRNAKRNA